MNNINTFNELKACRWNEDLSKQLLPCSTHFVNYVYHAASLYCNYSYIRIIQFNVRNYWLSFTRGCFDTLEATHGQVGKIFSNSRSKSANGQANDDWLLSHCIYYLSCKCRYHYSCIGSSA